MFQENCSKQMRPYDLPHNVISLQIHIYQEPERVIIITGAKNNQENIFIAYLLINEKNRDNINQTKNKYFKENEEIYVFHILFLFL